MPPSSPPAPGQKDSKTTSDELANLLGSSNLQALVAALNVGTVSGRARGSEEAPFDVAYDTYKLWIEAKVTKEDDYLFRIITETSPLIRQTLYKLRVYHRALFTEYGGWDIAHRVFQQRSLQASHKAYDASSGEVLAWVAAYRKVHPKQKNQGKGKGRRGGKPAAEPAKPSKPAGQ